MGFNSGRNALLRRDCGNGGCGDRISHSGRRASRQPEAPATQTKRRIRRKQILVNLGGFMKTPFVTYAARSDMGRVRRNNEDNLYCCGELMSEKVRDLPFKISGQISAPAIFAVCDGMGGYQLGEQASLIAVRVLADFACSILESPTHLLDELMQRYVAAVNQAIQKATASESSQMGTTLAFALILCGELRAYNIGDSRIYTLDKRGLRQISVDHTLSTIKIKSGIYTEAEARQSKDWNKLTACLGFLDDDGNDYLCESLEPIKLTTNTRLLLCSDGLTDVLTDDSIERILRSSKNAEQAVSNLMSDALNSGGTDNITAVVADVALRKFSRLIHVLSKSK